MEVSGLTTANEFGWYDASIVGIDLANSANRNPIFLAGETAPDSFVFNPTASFGFYLLTDLDQNPGNGTVGQAIYATRAADSTGSAIGNGEDLRQHFAIFQQQVGGALYIGAEDLPSSASCAGCLSLGTNKEGGVGDFNDLIVRDSAGPGSGAGDAAPAGLGPGWRRVLRPEASEPSSRANPASTAPPFHPGAGLPPRARCFLSRPH